MSLVSSPFKKIRKQKIRQKKTISSEQIFSNTEDDKIIILSGVSGSGKSKTIIEITRDCLINDEQRVFENSDKFSNIFNIYFRDSTHKTVGDVIKDSFPTNLTFFSKEEVRDGFKKFKQPILLTLDGYDEKNESSSKLFKDVLVCYKSNRRNIQLMISTRPSALEDLRETLGAEGLNDNFTVYAMEGLTDREGQINLLKIYGKEIGVYTDSLIEAYWSIWDCENPLFKIPIFLLLFSIIFKNNEGSSVNFTNSYSLYSGIRDLVKREFRNKLKIASVNNHQVIAEDLLGKLYDTSLELVNQGQYLLSDKKHTELIKFCRNNYEKDFSFDKLLSSVLVPKYSSLGECSYTFMHASIMEFFASLSILRNNLYTETRQKNDFLLF